MPLPALVLWLDPFQRFNMYAFETAEGLIFLMFLVAFTVFSIRHLMTLLKGDGEKPPPSDNRGGTP